MEDAVLLLPASSLRLTLALGSPHFVLALLYLFVLPFLRIILGMLSPASTSCLSHRQNRFHIQIQRWPLIHSGMCWPFLHLNSCPTCCCLPRVKDTADHVLYPKFLVSPEPPVASHRAILVGDGYADCQGRKGEFGNCSENQSCDNINCSNCTSRHLFERKEDFITT